MSFWAIAETHAMREVVAEANLIRKGFEVYLPRIKAKHNARRARQIVPLFPRYLFVRIERVWYPVLSVVGVLRLLRNGIGGEPARIDDDIVREIRAREVRGVVALPKRIAVGDRVRIVRGTFNDHIGIYDGMTGRERERVLLELLGRKVKVELDPEDFVAFSVAP